MSFDFSGALKIKELTYIHAEAILAGELKHGPLALIEPAMPIIMMIVKDDSYDKSINALEQIVARGGKFTLHLGQALLLNYHAP